MIFVTFVFLIGYYVCIQACIFYTCFIRLILKHVSWGREDAEIMTVCFHLLFLCYFYRREMDFIRTVHPIPSLLTQGILWKFFQILYLANHIICKFRQFCLMIQDLCTFSFGLCPTSYWETLSNRGVLPWWLILASKPVIFWFSNIPLYIT